MSSRDVDEMYGELKDIISSVETPCLKMLLSKFFLEDKEFEKRFKFHSAAKTVHHGFVGGFWNIPWGLQNSVRHSAGSIPC